MRTLALKKSCKGHYKVENDALLITVSNPYSQTGSMFPDSTNAWELIIEDKATDETLVSEWFETKKEASKFGAKWVIENL